MYADGSQTRRAWQLINRHRSAPRVSPPVDQPIYGGLFVFCFRLGKSWWLRPWVWLHGRRTSNVWDWFSRLAFHKNIHNGECLNKYSPSTPYIIVGVCLAQNNQLQECRLVELVEVVGECCLSHGLAGAARTGDGLGFHLARWCSIKNWRLLYNNTAQTPKPSLSLPFPMQRFTFPLHAQIRMVKENHFDYIRNADKRNPPPGKV